MDKEKRKSNKKVIGIAMVAIMIVSIFAMIAPASVARDPPPVPPGSNGIYYLGPDDGSVPAFCQNATVDVWINSTVLLFGGRFEITTNPDCGNIVIGSFDENTTVFNQGHVIHTDTGSVLEVAYLAVGYVEKQPGVYHLGNFSIHCNSTTCCATDLNFTPDVPNTYITNAGGNKDTVEDNGTFTCDIAPAISFRPTSPVSDYRDASRTFNVSIDQSVNVTWKIDGSVVQDSETNTMEALYTNTSAKVGSWTVSAVVESVSGGCTNTQEWTWNVLEPPVVVNEFASNADPEWIELHNKEGSEISLTGWTIEDYPSSPQSLDGKTIPADGYLVLTKGTDFTFTLANTGDTIILKNGGKEVDKVAYGDYDDGDHGDNAPKPDTGKSAGRHPDGVDTGVDSDDFQVFDTPTPGAPNTIAPTITGFAPTTPVTDNEGAARTFNVSVDQTVTVVWKINGTTVQTDPSVTEVSYTKTNAVAGYWKVTATASNTNGSVTQTWWWTVNDITAPTVTDWAPTGTDVSVTTNITATFNEAMNPDTLNSGTVIVKNSTGSTIAGDITYNSATKTVTFDPTSNLEYSETYDVNVTTGVADLAGNNLASHKTWSFTTSAPPSTNVAIGDYNLAPGSHTLPIMVNAVTNLGSGTINVSYNPAIVHVTDVATGTGNALKVQSSNVDNTTGLVQILALDADNPHSGDVIFANVTYETKGIEGQTTYMNLTVRDLEDYYNYTQIGHYLSNGSFKIKDNTPPVYSWVEKPEAWTTGESFLVSLIVTDNLGVTGYNITVANSTNDGTHTMDNINGDYYNYTIQVLNDSIADITYNCTFTDAEGVSNTTETVTMTVTDNDAPEIICVTGDTSTTTGEDAPITASFADNIGVTYAKMFWQQIGEEWESDDITNATAYVITADDDAVGNISYYISIADADVTTGFVNSSTYNITVTDDDKPTITVALSRDTILNDNGRARGPGTNVSVLSVNVTDNVRNVDDWVTSPIVDLDELGLATAADLDHESGEYGLWNGSSAIKATTETGINLANTLVINVTDGAGNWQIATVNLTVLRRGDVVRDGNITSGDVLWIAKYLVGKETTISMLVADVVPATCNDQITSGDALYISKYLVAIESAP